MSAQRAAFLHVRRDRQDRIRPLVTSHGANSTRTDVSRFRLEFDWMGTRDPSAWLAIPAALEFMGSLFPGGWPQLQAHNRALVLQGRQLLCDRLGVAPPAPAEMLGSLATIILPGDGPVQPDANGQDALHAALWDRHRIEVPVMTWSGRRLLRISAQVYNAPGQYEVLADALTELLA